MAIIIEMPKLSDTMTVGTLLSWTKNEGDTIESGDMIAEVETDKATMEVEAFEDGVLLAKYAKEGDQIPIGGALCAIGEAGEEAPPAPAGEEAPAEEPKAESPAPAPAPEPKAEPAPVATTPDPDAGPANRKNAFSPADRAAPEPAPVADGERIKASPLARKLAKEHGVDITAVQGTGPRGRVVKADVLAAKEAGPTTPAAPAAAAPQAFVPAGAGVQPDSDTPVSNMRATIARRLVESKTQLPHFYLDMEVDAAPLLKMRAAVNASLAGLTPEQGGIKLTVNDFILKATAEAIRRVPAVNTSWLGDTVRAYSGVHLAFGVAVDEGLLTPVVRDAHVKSVRQISAEAKELIAKARSRKLKPDEMSGSTFTVTNLGMYGINGFYGIINPPNAAILSVGATIKKPVVNANDEIVIGQRMNLGLSGDHRVIDGATGAEFLMALREVLETPALMMV